VDRFKVFSLCLSTYDSCSIGLIQYCFPVDLPQRFAMDIEYNPRMHLISKIIADFKAWSIHAFNQ